jgi:hypothetical protein
MKDSPRTRNKYPVTVAPANLTGLSKESGKGGSGRGKEDFMSEWKNIDSMPQNELVLVWSSFRGIELRRKNAIGDLYDENGDFDDSELEYDLWCKIPPLP